MLEELRPVVWSAIERRCLYLLQRTDNTKRTLLRTHAFILRNALDANPNLLAKFIATCASLSLTRHARKVFDLCLHRDDAFVCNSMIKAHVGSRQFAQAFALYQDLRRQTRFDPDSFTFTALAKSCTLGKAIWEGLEMHCQVLKFGFCSDLCVSTGLVDMYAKYGEMDMAARVFDEMTDRSLVSWTVLIGGYARSGNLERARVLFDRMPEKDPAVYNAIIDGYVKVGDMAVARRLFDEMPEKNVISWTTLIHGYCSIGDVSSARSLFDLMSEKNLVSWNAMINGHSQNKQPREALELFHELQSSTRLEPDAVTIVTILPAIADLGALELGNWVREFVRRKKLDGASNVCTALVDMYAKCGEVGVAREVFDGMKNKETISWNVLINAYAINGCVNEALEAFLMMQHQGVKPNDVTMLSLLSACNHGGLVEEGKKWFKAIDDFGITRKIEHYGCMVDLLGRAGCLDEAERLIETMPFKANGIIMSSFLFACWYFKDVTRALRMQDRAVSLEPWNDSNYIMLRNLFATTNQWGDVQKIKGLMKEIGVNKEAGSSAIEVDGNISEFLAGGTMHPQWKGIELVLRRLSTHMRPKMLPLS